MSDISRDLRIGVQCYNVRSCEWCILYAATKLKMAMHDVYCVCVWPEKYLPRIFPRVLW